MTAAIARTRKDVEIANYEDQLTNIRQKFDSLINIFSDSMTEECKLKCKAKLKEQVAHSNQANKTKLPTKSDEMFKKQLNTFMGF